MCYRLALDGHGVAWAVICGSKARRFWAGLGMCYALYCDIGFGAALSGHSGGGVWDGLYIISRISMLLLMLRARGGRKGDRDSDGGHVCTAQLASSNQECECGLQVLGRVWVRGDMRFRP